jgi:hypothetical protein
MVKISIKSYLKGIVGGLATQMRHQLNNAREMINCFVGL